MEGTIPNDLMWGISMSSINPYVERSIKQFVYGYLKMHQSCSLENVLNNYDHIESATEGDVRKTIYSMIKLNELFFLNPNDTSDTSLFSISETFQLLMPLDNNFKIVVSKPNMREFTVKKVGDRSHQIDTID